MSPKTNIAHYRLVAKLGEGGMGEVWRATDTRLGRDVAIKFLPDAFAGDADRMARFQREAQILASLNHPNIAAIYGVEDRALVMELVEGKTPAGPLPAGQMLSMIHDLVEALEYAHDRGIVHRDLKPSNLRITPDLRVKVLDFGLAKACSADRAETPQSEASPTVTMNETMAGLILGTPAYMAPEQAGGLAVDKRADIWSFGVVVYELLTGKQLFQGKTTAEVLAAVLHHEPDFAAVPRRFRRMLRLCLMRNPRERLRDISGVRLLLDEPEVERRKPSGIWLAGVAAIAIAAAAWWPRSHQDENRPVRFEFVLPDDVVELSSIYLANMVPSPDGRRLAYVGRERKTLTQMLWVRGLDSFSAQRIEGSQNAKLPVWSPDSKYVAYFGYRELKKVPAGGGTPETICAVEGVVHGVAWSSGGVILFSTQDTGAVVMRVSAAGGSPAPATRLDAAAGEVRHTSPAFLPDGRHCLFLAVNQNPANSAIYVQDLTSGQRKRVMLNRNRAVFANGHLLFARDASLFAQPFNPRTLELEGQPAIVGEPLSSNLFNGDSGFAASDGVLVFHDDRGHFMEQLAWYDRQGHRTAVGPSIDMHPLVLSPDGTRAAIQRHGATFKDNVWIMDLATGELAQATSDGHTQLPVWSPDSQQLALNNTADAGSGIRLMSLSSGKQVSLIADATEHVEDWSPDGASLLTVSQDGHRISLCNIAQRKLVTIFQSAYVCARPRISPDGRRVAYLSGETGKNELYVAAFPAFSDRQRMTIGGAESAEWSRDGKRLVFRAAGKMMWAEVPGAAKSPLSAPRELFPVPEPRGAFPGFGIARDGRILLAEPARQGPTKFDIVLNWTADLRR